MKKFSLFLAFALVGAVGCEKASSTAPSTNPNKPGDTLKLTVAAKDQTVTQGETDDVTIVINRDNFKEAVSIELRNLPAGVSVNTKDATIAADKNTFVVQIKAAADATPVKDHKFQVVGKAPGIPEVVLDKLITVKAK